MCNCQGKKMLVMGNTTGDGTIGDGQHDIADTFSGTAMLVREEHHVYKNVLMSIQIVARPEREKDKQTHYQKDKAR